MEIDRVQARDLAVCGGLVVFASATLMMFAPTAPTPDIVEANGGSCRPFIAQMPQEQVWPSVEDRFWSFPAQAEADVVAQDPPTQETRSQDTRSHETRAHETRSHERRHYYRHRRRG